jgi:hypothetical protein
MTVLLALLLFVAVFPLSLAHFYWSRGSHWPMASEEALARAVIGDGRRRMPGRIPCLAVSMLLCAVSLFPLCALDPASRLPVRHISVIIAGVFVARGIAGYTPTWRGHFRDEPFATFDKRYYSPLCILLGLAYVAFGSGEFGR